MILNNFYHIQQQSKTADGLQASITINPEHKIFEGHFPGQPVVPGVCMIQIVKEFLEQSTLEKLIMTEATQVKFLNIIVPNKEELIELNLKWKLADPKIWIVQATLAGKSGICFKLNGEFRKS